MATGLRAAAGLAALAGLLLVGANAHAADDPPPAPTRWVTDRAGLLAPADVARLDRRLEAYQAARGHHLLVWIDDTLDGRPLEDFATRTFAAWRVGRAGVDDGLVVFVFARDRALAIEVGYGLEGQVTDALAHRVIDETMAPRLRAGDPAGAVEAAIDALTTAIDGVPFAGEGTPAPARVAPPRRAPIGFFVLGGLFLVLMLFHPRLAMVILWSIAAGGGRRGGGTWTGGGGGGGWSGGGGRSGGGGARGGW